METYLLALQLNFFSLLVGFFPPKVRRYNNYEHVQYTYFIILHSPFYFTFLASSCIMEIFN